MEGFKTNDSDTRNAAIQKLEFESLYQEISRDWQQKAEKLQQRRWRKLHLHAR